VFGWFSKVADIGAILFTLSRCRERRREPAVDGRRRFDLPQFFLDSVSLGASRRQGSKPYFELLPFGR
jgi:hypothetical protein